MTLRYGITTKLFIWFSTFILIFYGTILVLFTNVKQIVEVSENIVNKNYEISSTSKKMIENLLSMEENEKKYRLLKKKDYLDYFLSAREEFENNLLKVIHLESHGKKISLQWETLYHSYGGFHTKLEGYGDMKGDQEWRELSETIWIPESVINEWIQKISLARTENEKEIESATRDLNRRSVLSARNGLVGVGISILVGIVGITFLAYSMIRPLRELLKGIRSIPKERLAEPIQIRSKDEFGELANAFNDMAMRLKEEERMRSDFISMLSHEIRTPLTSIRESVNMIAEEVMGNINQQQRKFLEIASSEIGRICDLLNHLMKVSRLESGAIRIQPLPLDPASTVSNCILKLNQVAEAKKINIEMYVSPGVPCVMADPEQLQQVLLNLLDNAIKFSTPNSRICVRVEPDEDPTRLKFSVSDNGPGIRDEELPYIFNKYYRGHGVREHMDGVGLGLSISKHIIKAHEGRIWVKSKIGHGSTFGFSLPIV